ncbi:MAG TPA: hypothetical protein VM866_00050, partial [Pyrinomonadaceae bacterium]|nr:hypothetical protein [Pyrinomonadaceae bacterium]
DTGVETDLMYPRQMPDLFRGSQIALIGRYRNERDLRNINLTLRGRNGSEARSFAYPNLRFPLTENDNDFLPRLWATRRVGWLMEQVRSNGENKELRDEIVDLGTRYGIVTPYTSYLALESQETRFVAPGGQTASNTAQTQNLPPMGRSATGTRMMRRPSANNRGGAADAAASPAAASETVTVTSGADAVKESKAARMKQESLRADDDEVSKIAGRKIKNKTFYQRDDVLVDAEFKTEARLPETTLTFGSEEYFALLKREPELAEFFALNEQVIVVHKGRVYRVKAATG